QAAHAAPRQGAQPQPGARLMSESSAAAVKPVDLPEHMREPALIEGPHTDLTLTNTILAPVWRDPMKGWWMLLSITGTFLGILGLSIAYLLITGVGVWGNNSPCYW